MPTAVRGATNRRKRPLNRPLHRRIPASSPHAETRRWLAAAHSGPSPATCAAAIASGSGANCWMALANPAKLGRKCGLLSCSRTDAGSEIFGVLANTSPASAYKITLQFRDARVEAQALIGKWIGRNQLVRAADAPVPLGLLDCLGFNLGHRLGYRLDALSAFDLVVPLAVECARPCASDRAMDHRAETALFQDGAHVHVDHKESDCDQRHAGVDQNAA